MYERMYFIEIKALSSQQAQGYLGVSSGYVAFSFFALSVSA